MQLIADSGSTKTNWSLTDGKSVLKEIFTLGINPFYQSEHEISDEIEKHLKPKLNDYSIKSITFYGAGCSFPEKKAFVANALGKHFPNAVIEIQSDLLGAARSLFGRKEGIACILGTGSNSCYYDGKQIVENVSPLGFMLGDEGSGAVLSKTLVADCLKKQMPERLSKKFFDQYDLTPATIMESVYKKPFPNRFLAKFTPFLSENMEEPAIYNIVAQGFDSFFKRNILQYPEGKQVGFIGSVAYHFRGILEDIAKNQGFTVSKIEQNPMSGLITYHSI
jgi:N-acetylglucosamine kinase-like BadF-type ATPase